LIPFYFIALISNRPINLDWGMLFAVDWSNQLLHIKTFSHAVFFDNQTNDLIKTQAMILVA
jgi:hypothetical protein